MKAIHHVAITVADLAGAREFYTRVLGLTERTDRPGELAPGTWLDVGGQQVHLVAGTPPAAQGQHFALLVDDLDATVGQLRAEGVQVSDPVPIGKARQCFLADPSGTVPIVTDPTTATAEMGFSEQVRCGWCPPTFGRISNAIELHEAAK
ncbi:VOC family protein [Amycolatopsis sp.]|uniref:VOC family protein n=1 Tax=Amycolatopsis sp. TaxID=37632 RepID=UPI002C0641E6|nr:VOC family protein [Amycolatopsis sp.]HVV12991.1 VOC family protein [Amycolatopsis sp.]